MENKFKKGDIVRCIKQAVLGERSRYYLPLGSCFTVTYSSPMGIKFKEIDSQVYYNYARFEKVVELHHVKLI